MKAKIVRYTYLFCGCLCVVLGFIGVILPLLPTTPFLLVAAFCFSRSSERLHQSLLNNRYFGNYIREWENGGVIPLKIKIVATTMMLLMVIYPLFFKAFHIGLKLAVVVTIIIAVLYIWSRPSALESPE